MNVQEITQPEYDFLQARLKELANTDRLVTVDLKESLNQGSETWHDNDTFDTAKVKKQAIAQEVAALNQILKYSKIVSSPKTINTVQIGTKVTLKNLDTLENTVRNIGGEQAARLGEDWMSLKAPLGGAIKGKKLNDKVNLELPSGDILYKIVVIEAQE